MFIRRPGVVWVFVLVTGCVITSSRGRSALADDLQPPVVGGFTDGPTRQATYSEQSHQPGVYNNRLLLAEAGNGSQRRQSQGQRSRRSKTSSDAETQMRLMLLKRSMGFGGIFAPMLKGSGGKGSSGDDCARRGYSDYAACQAHKAGDGWAADRLQRRQSNGAERDWYNR